MQPIPENIQNEINSYFEKNKLEKKIINKENLTSAIRKLISRSISGTRQEMEIKPDTKLKYYIIKEELWNKKVLETEGFENEIDEIFKSEILVGQSVELYNFLDGDMILYDKSKEKNKEKNNNIKEGKNNNKDTIQTKENE